MRISSLPFLVLLTFTSASIVGQDSFLSDYKIKWKNAAAYTLEFARTMPEDLYDYTPTEVEMTFREQLRHIAGNMVWLSSSYLGGEAKHVDPTKAGSSKKEIIAMLEQAFAYATTTVNALTDKDLDRQVDFFAGRMSRQRILLLMTDHVTHHRGQLVVYLRMRGIEPPKYVGW